MVLKDLYRAAVDAPVAPAGVPFVQGGKFGRRVILRDVRDLRHGHSVWLDGFTDDGRRLIAAPIPSGEVQKIPQNTGGESLLAITLLSRSPS